MEQTTGEKKVRTDFNVSNSDTVNQIKQKGAELINLIESLPDGGYDVGRLKSLAMTDIESGTSWAVKAATAK